jgi:hypothetical protein
MYEAMAWLEGSAFAEALRGLGVWTYGITNLIHILAIGMLFGAILILDLRLLGAWRSIPISTIARPTVPLAGAGVVIALCSGVSMFAINTTEYHGNPFLYIKLPVLLVALINVFVITRLNAWRHAISDTPLQGSDRLVLAVAGGTSLLLWLTVISCGRMIGYW